jgi:hypothetical protein
MDAHEIEVERQRSFAHKGFAVRGFWIVGEQDESRRPGSRWTAFDAWSRNRLGNALLIANLVLVGRAVVSESLLETGFIADAAGSGRIWPGLQLAEAFLGGLYVLASAPSWMIVNTICALGLPVIDFVDFSTRTDVGLALFVVVSSFQWLAIGNGWPRFAKAIKAAFCLGSQEESDSIVPKAASPRMLDAAFVTPIGSPLEDVLEDANRIAVGFDRRVEHATVSTTHG